MPPLGHFNERCGASCYSPIKDSSLWKVISKNFTMPPLKQRQSESLAPHWAGLNTNMAACNSLRTSGWPSNYLQAGEKWHCHTLDLQSFSCRILRSQAD